MKKYKIDIRMAGRADGTPITSSVILYADTPEEAREALYERYGDYYIVSIEEVEQ